MRTQYDVPKIIEDLYAGTLEQERWAAAIVGLADLVSGAAAFIFSVDLATSSVLRDEHFRFDAAAGDIYRRDWISKDVRVAASLRVPAGEAYFESKIMPAKQWTRSEVYNEFLRPHDTPWFLAALLHKSPTRVVNFSINSTRKRGPFDERDARRIQPLIPHLKRAIEIKDRLDILQVRSDTLATCLNVLNFGVVVLDACGRVLEVNGVAQDLLRHDSGVRRNPDGTLSLRGSAGNELAHWISTGTPSQSNRDGLLRVMRPLARPISILMTRLPAPHTFWMEDNAPAWMLMLFDPDKDLDSSAELIARDLLVSAREAEIVGLLAAGYDSRTIAARLRISVHTVRAHMKAIYSKTGTRSQAELSLRVATGPVGARHVETW